MASNRRTMSSSTHLLTSVALAAAFSIICGGGAHANPHTGDPARTSVYSLPPQFPPHLPPPDFVFSFYLHDNLISKENRSAFAVTLPVADVETFTLADQSWLLKINQSFFGSIVVFDDSMTIGPLSNSTEVGRGRGIYVFDKLNDATNEQQGVEWMYTAIFNEQSGLGNSTLCFKGWDYFLEPLKEIPICGGTGKFKLARGYAEISTEFVDAVTAVIKFKPHVYF